jgi:hypothetical protein
MTYEAKNWSLLLSDQCVIHLLVDEVLDINGLCLAFFPTHEHLMAISKEVDKTCMNSIQIARTWSNVLTKEAEQDVVESLEPICLTNHNFFLA